MTAKSHSLLQKISKPLEIFGIIIICFLTIILLGMIALAYIFNVDIPGLRGKTIWDWLQLLIIPAVLAVGGYLFNYTTSRSERNATQQRNQTEHDIATDNQRETALQAYIDKISELLLDKHLREPQSPDDVRTIARVRTLTTLPRLDEARKGGVVQFLYESQLIRVRDNIIDLVGANLFSANLFRADLRGADLSGTDLRVARLFGANLSEANLSEANLRGANLSGANLSEADLHTANLIGADLSGANLSGADLSGANLSGANLSGANLRGADLSGTIVTQTQLDQTRSLANTTIPINQNINSKF